MYFIDMAKLCEISYTCINNINNRVVSEKENSEHGEQKLL